MAGNRPYDEERLKALAYLGIAKGLREPVKLAVFLWRCDFDAYAKLGASITGATYFKNPDPALNVPTPTRFWQVLGALIAEGKIRLWIPGREVRRRRHAQREAARRLFPALRRRGR